jgi:endonuclease-3
VEKKLLSVVPKEYALDAHHWLILHGRYVCKARKPECYRCVVVDLCRYKPKTLNDKQAAELLPAKTPARKAKPTSIQH